MLHKLSRSLVAELLEPLAEQDRLGFQLVPGFGLHEVDGLLQVHCDFERHDQSL